MYEYVQGRHSQKKKILVSNFEFRYRRSGKIMLRMADEEYALEMLGYGLEKEMYNIGLTFV
jgi:hypothetical protein